MKNKNGFTLVELLAVTIILIIVFLIAINAIGERTKKSKMDSVKASALGYFKTVRSVCETSTGDDSPFKMNDYSISELTELGVQVNGKKPKGGFVYFEDNEPYCGCVAYGKYKVEYVNEKFSEVKKGSCSKTKMNCKAHSKYQITEIDYTGTTEQISIIKNGYYKVEVWGAQGGAVTSATNIIPGYGSYSVGIIHLNANDRLFVTVGGAGLPGVGGVGGAGGYNGGGSGADGRSQSSSYPGSGGGGGATHIATVPGVLSSLEQYKGNLSSDSTYYVSSNIIIVAGGGGGVGAYYTSASAAMPGGSGGGKSGVNGTIVDSSVTLEALAGTQISGFQFGKGGNGRTGTSSGSASCEGTGGGGGGFFGGAAQTTSGEKTDSSGAGGSGYIGNSDLTSAVMYCYNCDESPVAETKTISTDCVSEKPTRNCAKKGNGYARISLYADDNTDSEDYDD